MSGSTCARCSARGRTFPAAHFSKGRLCGVCLLSDLEASTVYDLDALQLRAELEAERARHRETMAERDRLRKERDQTEAERDGAMGHAQELESKLHDLELQLKAARAPAKPKTFPIQAPYRGEAHYGKPYPARIPWWLAEEAFGAYSSRYGRDQSLEQLAARGGFGTGEMDTFRPGWIEAARETTDLRAELARLGELVAKIRASWVPGELRFDLNLQRVRMLGLDWLLEGVPR